MKGNRFIIVFVILIVACGNDSDLRNLILDPAAATLIFPENVSQCFEGNILSATESEVTFRWHSSENTDNYELHLTNLSNGNTQIFETDNTEIIVTLERGVPYSWFINSTVQNSNNVQTSEVWSFYNAGEAITSYVPFPAVALNPSEGEVVNNVTSISLVWQAIDLDDNIISYDVFFGTTLSPQPYQSEITVTNLSGILVSMNSTYFWSVTTRDLDGNESRSKVFTFEVN